MKEEIKNWIDLQKDEDLIEISGKTLYKILDKYNNQPDYKSAWNELKESQSTNCAYVNLGEELEVRFEELEEKYNLGGE